jgi:hypothetical protein
MIVLVQSQNGNAELTTGAMKWSATKNTTKAIRKNKASTEAPKKKKTIA